MKDILKRVLLLSVIFAVVAGCSGSKEKEIPAYFSATTIPALKVPADLDEPYRSQGMQLPEAAFQLQFSADTDVEELLKPPRIIDDSES